MVMSIYKAEKFHQMGAERFRKSKHKGTYQSLSKSCAADGDEKSQTAGCFLNVQYLANNYELLLILLRSYIFMEPLFICFFLFILSLTYSLCLNFKGKILSTYQNKTPLFNKQTKLKQIPNFWLFWFASEIITSTHSTPYQSLVMHGKDSFAVHAIILSRKYKMLKPGRC